MTADLTVVRRVIGDRCPDCGSYSTAVLPCVEHDGHSVLWCGRPACLAAVCLPGVPVEAAA